MFWSAEKYAVAHLSSPMRFFLGHLIFVFFFLIFGKLKTFALEAREKKNYAFSLKTLQK